jgi:hypothetical protein
MKPSPKLVAKLARKIDPQKPRDERMAKAAELVNEWGKGFSQNLRGENRAAFVEAFLNIFPEEVQRSIEESARELYGVRNFSRFRTKLLMEYATAYQNGAVHAKEGVSVDMISEMQKIARDQGERAKARTREDIEALRKI